MLTIDQVRDFKGKYPRQIWSLFFSEMWERFCFYGMRGMLVFFMITQLNFGDIQANLQYGATQAFVYAFTFVGGLFADKILGFWKSLYWGGSEAPCWLSIRISFSSLGFPSLSSAPASLSLISLPW
ncbi:MAG TPA: hypothetical protein PLC76_10910 [Saprospiraceae bacterium]|nr:hypothetical protein [Saprospiraceae bacterium]